MAGDHISSEILWLELSSKLIHDDVLLVDQQESAELYEHVDDFHNCNFSVHVSYSGDVLNLRKSAASAYDNAPMCLQLPLGPRPVRHLHSAAIMSQTTTFKNHLHTINSIFSHFWRQLDLIYRMSFTETD